MIECQILNIGSVSMNKYWGEKERVRQASATCTLLTLPDGARWIVDPSPQPEPLAKQLFDRTGLWPDAVQGVFITHYHGDHRFGLELFEGVPWTMAGPELVEWQQHAPIDGPIIDQFVPAEETLPRGLSLIHLPGHTLQLYGLAFDSVWGRTAITGDAVMTRDFFRDEAGYHNTLDWEAVAETQRMLKRDFDVIIPGHDNLLPTGR